jgi:hypothetical protein
LGLHRNKKPLLSHRGRRFTHHKTHIYLLHPYYTTSKAGARKPRPTRSLREAAVEATPLRLLPQRLLSCGPSLTSSPGQVPPPDMVTQRLAPRRTGVSHLEHSEEVLCFARVATTLLHECLPWVTTLLYPTASERGEGMLAMLFWVLAVLSVVGVLAIVRGLYLLARRWL